MSQRDNFKKKVIDKLKARVANRCSNPTCRVPTSAPADNEGVNNIGVAAHICAASPGGPRYDPSMTFEIRTSIHNALWLCANCSIDIDRDPVRYTVSVLREWKRIAENAARDELGKRLPNNNDAIDTVAAALTGFPKSYLATAISNVHAATARSLESLDPRFAIKTAHDDAGTSFGIFAKEDVPLVVKVSEKYSNEYMEKHRRLIEHGEDFEIASEAITIEGSALFDELFEQRNGVFKISSNRIPATQKLWLVDDGSSILESFDDINGTVSLGSQSFSFQGYACGGTFQLNYQKTLDESETKANINMSLNLVRWEGESLNDLPFFSKLLSLFKKMAEGWRLYTSLEVNGIAVITSHGMKVNGLEYVRDTANYLNYVNRCRIIAKSLNVDIKYTSEVSFTADDHKALADIAATFEGAKEFGEDDITSNASCELIVSSKCENVKALAVLTEPTLVQIVEQSGEKLSLFGTEVYLPPKTVYLESVLPKIHRPIEDIEEGDTVTVEWVPQSGFRCSIRYGS